MTLSQDAVVTANRALHYLEKLLTDYDRVTESDEFAGVFALSHIHGMPYSGPVFDRETIEEARAFLANHTGYLSDGQGPE
jgi:hypothetical protein